MKCIYELAVYMLSLCFMFCYHFVVHFKEDPKLDPQHSAEFLIQGLQARIEYMNTNLVFLRLSKAELNLHDEWCLREAKELIQVAVMQQNAVPRESISHLRRSSTTNAARIGDPPVFVTVHGEANWDQLQVAVRPCSC